MQGWQFVEIGAPLELVTQPDPTPGPDQVVVDVRAGGLCHSDVGIMDGTITSMLAQIPIVLGHEVAGVVCEVGPGVTGWQVGDRVAIAGLGIDAPGLVADGGFGDKVVGKVSQLVRLPDEVGFAQGAAATDAGQTSRHALRLGGVGPGSRVGIIGLGGLGLTAARIAVLLGAQVYGAEPNERVHLLARRRGVLDIVTDAADLAAFDLDVICDFAGFGTTTAAAVEAVRDGGTVVLVGMGRAEATIPTPTFISKQLTLVGSLGGSMADVTDVIRLMAEEGLEILITEIPFEQIPDGLERLHQGKVGGRLVAVY
jgi:alcohol dehydrogenase, propanol-preferring